MKVKDAVRISMSIPFYFEAVFIDSIGKVVSHPRKKTGLDVMLDGGFIATFPSGSLIVPGT
jgi:NTE family protein